MNLNGDSRPRLSWGRYSLCARIGVSVISRTCSSVSKEETGIECLIASRSKGGNRAGA
jgi:hypothetical protein